MDYRIHGIPAAVLRLARSRADRAGQDFGEVARRLIALYAEETIDPMVDDPIASAHGRRMSQRRTARLSDQQREAVARHAALTRWGRR